jgi:hypothetical protein
VTPRVLLLLLLALAGLAIASGLRAPAPPVTNDGTVTGTGSFTEEFMEHLETVRVAADALVDLGERRERNLLIVGQRQSAMNAALDATDTWLARQTAHQDDPAVVSYRSGAALIRQAMADAQSAFLHFDWDGIAAANETLNEGVIEIHTAATAIGAGM